MNGAHILDYLPMSVDHAAVFVKSVGEKLSAGIQLVQNGVSILLLACSEHADCAELRNTPQKLIQIRPFVHENFTAKFLVLIPINSDRLT